MLENVQGRFSRAAFFMILSTTSCGIRIDFGDAMSSPFYVCIQGASC
jgi:hypothetical protein